MIVTKTEQAFLDFFEHYDILTKSTTFLLAVSGGLDSMVLAELFVRSKLDFQVAHANFKLRAEDSDDDEYFVKRWCTDRGIPVYTRAFDTASYASQRKMSIQMAARELRYTWFRQLLRKQAINYLVTAHHLDDDIETFFINLSRNSGLHGLKSIPPVEGVLLRPLLSCARNDIETYAKTNDLKWREDRSNMETKYLRNKIRHELIPSLEHIIPKIRSNIAETLTHLKEDSRLLHQLVNQLQSTSFVAEGDSHIFDLAILDDYQTPINLLHHLLKPYGFSYTQCENMYTAQHKSGKRFDSPNHLIVLDRGRLILQHATSNSTDNQIRIHAEAQLITLPDGWQLKVYSSLSQPNRKTAISINETKVHWPLRIRYWQTGDFFHPKGMNGQRQKLKKYFVNQKITLLDKHKIPLLVDDQDNILWVIGYRADERFEGSDWTIEILS